MTKKTSPVMLNKHSPIKLGPLTVPAISLRRAANVLVCSGVALVAMADLVVPEHMTVLSHVLAGIGIGLVIVAACLNAAINWQAEPEVASGSAAMPRVASAKD